MSKRQYLELMGIDVWQKRLPGQSVPRVAVSGEVAQLAEPKLAAAGQSGASALASVKASLVGSDEQTPVIQEKATVPVKAAKPDLEVSEPAPEFFLAFSHYANLSMANLYPSGFAAIPGNHKRFLNTLYFALRGEKLGSDVQEFRWPMLKSDRISQSRDDAKQVLGRHMQHCQPDLLVFGSETADLLAAPSAEPYSLQVVRERNLLLVEDAEIYFRDPSQRRQLWAFLGEIRKRLRANA